MTGFNYYYFIYLWVFQSAYDAINATQSLKCIWLSINNTFVLTWLSVMPTVRFSYRLQERSSCWLTANPPPDVAPNVAGNVAVAVNVVVRAAAAVGLAVVPFAAGLLAEQPPPFVIVVVVDSEVLCIAILRSKPCELFHKATAIRLYNIYGKME